MASRVVSDAVILLDHRVHDRVSTRRLRREISRPYHGTSDAPFLITQDGVSVLPVSSMGLEHRAPLERRLARRPRRDAQRQGLLPGQHRAFSGTAGTGKTSLATHFIDAACRRGGLICFLLKNRQTTDRHALDRHRPRAWSPPGCCVPPTGPHDTASKASRGDASGRRRLQANVAVIDRSRI